MDQQFFPARREMRRSTIGPLLKQLSVTANQNAGSENGQGIALRPCVTQK
jgi:hypothetical protein